MNKSAANLSEWLKAQNKKQFEFAKELGISNAALSRLIKGHQKPTLEFAFRLEIITGGKVRAQEWVDALLAEVAA